MYLIVAACFNAATQLDQHDQHAQVMLTCLTCTSALAIDSSDLLVQICIV